MGVAFNSHCSWVKCRRHGREASTFLERLSVVMHKRSVTICKLCMYTWTVTEVTVYSFAAVIIKFLAWDVLFFRFFPLLFFLNKRGFLERFNFFFQAWLCLLAQPKLKVQYSQSILVTVRLIISLCISALYTLMSITILSWLGSHCCCHIQ